MKSLYTILLLLITSPLLHANPQTAEKEIKLKPPISLTLNFATGGVLATNTFVSKDLRIPSYNAIAFKVAAHSIGNRWEDIAYGMPYMGLGFYAADFHRKKDLGNPISLYMFQGARIASMGKRWSLHYEWNLGASFAWISYDPFTNPNNEALGSESNIHVGLNLYTKFRINKNWALHLGAGYTHFSNGAMRLPNMGINTLAPFVEVSYNLNQNSVINGYNPTLTPPKFTPRIDSDILLTITSRQTRFPVTEANKLPSPFIDHNFKVIGLSYAALFTSGYRYKWGPSIELVYDESAHATAWREINPFDNREYERIKLGKAKDRIALGLSMKGEINLSNYALFMNLGYNLINANDNDSRFYQILGIKLYLKENLFGTFGIRATNFGKATYLFWSLGYTFEKTGLRRKGIM